MKPALLFLLLCLGSFQLSAQSLLKLHAETIPYPEKIVDGHFEHHIVDTLDQYILQYVSDDTYAYRGGLLIHDTKKKVSHKIILPIAYSSYLAEEGNFVRVEDGAWVFEVKAGPTDFGSMLATPPLEAGAREYFLYEFRSEDHGLSWAIRELR